MNAFAAIVFASLLSRLGYQKTPVTVEAATITPMNSGSAPRSAAKAGRTGLRALFRAPVSRRTVKIALNSASLNGCILSRDEPCASW